MSPIPQGLAVKEIEYRSPKNPEVCEKCGRKDAINISKHQRGSYVAVVHNTRDNETKLHQGDTPGEVVGHDTAKSKVKMEGGVKALFDRYSKAHYVGYVHAWKPRYGCNHGEVYKDPIGWGKVAPQMNYDASGFIVPLLPHGVPRIHTHNMHGDGSMIACQAINPDPLKICMEGYFHCARIGNTVYSGSGEANGLVAVVDLDTRRAMISSKHENVAQLMQFSGYEIREVPGKHMGWHLFGKSLEECLAFLTVDTVSE